MATVLRSRERDFRQNPNRLDEYRFMIDVSRKAKGIEPKSLNFDLRQLEPGCYSSTYHFHRHGEELFVILGGSATLRTPRGLETVDEGDMIFFETGETGAHQLYNHTDEICTYLDIRTFNGFDICEYPDSDKLLLIPSMEIFKRNSGLKYFDGEENIRAVWKGLKYVK